ncbi:dienelactone hydrolase family protein [Mesorhizobium sp. J428]|uniref:dienelactone hydrolase family protein n=1 Tax=Mesorhizobium sp. J428 TaxID=2898440 RepID=UPI0021513B91|nr:dienelactone hydrolase family protein [Mesorhizobium sp. J428]MCR5856322.1 dienelactone hydrolase family protein [Mesorhizobium sp. J428]
MGELLRLRAADGHELGAYRAAPAGTPIGGIVVLQEIFGVNSHIRGVCDAFAAEGYVAIAPALFDRFARDFASGYSPEEITAALAYLKSLDWDALMLDTRAAIERVRQETEAVSLVGFCLGGSLAFLAATQGDGLDAAVCYYGGMIAKFADAKPLCPVMMHYGETDSSIPLSNVETVRVKCPEAEIHLYPAGHGFNRGAPGTADAAQAAIAWQRTLRFLSNARTARP